MNINRMVMAAAALFALALVPAAYAADNGTEFGIEDDLTVLGTGGTAVDPDMEVKGFTVFGATQAAPALNIPAAPGNIFANGYVQVSSGMYVAGSSTFTARVKLPNASGIFVSDGATGEVLKKQADGSLIWAADNDGGAAGLTGTPLRLLMIEADGTGAAASLFLQNSGGTNITMISGSSLTISGAFETAGVAKLNGDVNLGDAVGDTVASVGAFTAQNGLSVTGGDAAVTNNLTVNGGARLGNAVTDTHGVNMAAETDVALAVDGGGTAGKYAAKFYSGGSLAAWLKKK